MKPIDILYTPLDVAAVPEFDLNKLNQWISSTYASARPYSTAIITDEGIHGKNYPWDLTHAYYDMKGDGPGWINNFDKEFPELATHLSTALGVPLSEYGEILLLPVRPTHTGFGFWHQDPDKAGIRLYLEFDCMENNKLLMRRTIIPYTERVTLSHAEYANIDDYLLPELINCPAHSRTQWFYLNNDRAVHSTLTTVPGKTRIAVIVGGRPNQDANFISGVEELILRSATKFSEYAVYWDRTIPSNETHFTGRLDIDNMKKIYPDGSV